MTNQNQTSIPMKPQFPLRWIFGTMAAFLIIGFWLMNTGNAESGYQPQTLPAEQNYKQWVSERDTRECEEQKKVAKANYNDVLHGFKVDKDMNSLKTKMEKPCEVGFVPAAKALSFENSETLKTIEKPQEPHPVHHGSPEQQQYIDYAWNTYHDKNFIYLLKAENGLITPDRMHPQGYYCKGRLAHDWGFGGVSDCHHSDITSNPLFFSDPYWQIDQVYRLYKGGTKFASRKNWPEMAQYFDWIN